MFPLWLLSEDLSLLFSGADLSSPTCCCAQHPGLSDPGAILWLPACVLSFPAEHAALGIRDLGILPPGVTTTFGELGVRLEIKIYGGTHPSV